jgi:prepilin-type N-terminal cleavage/methylation domain-containing protein
MIVAGHRPSNRDDTGFTLIELLVVLVLVGLITTMLAGALHFGVRETRLVSGHTERADMLASAYGILRSQIADAEPYPLTADAPHPPIVFVGRSSSLDFITLPAAALAPAGLKRVHMDFERKGRDGRLTLRWDDDPADPSGQRFATRILLDDVAELQLEYFGAIGAEGIPRWYAEWEGIDHLPSLARLRLRFTDGRVAPDLIVRLRHAPP